MEKMNDLLKAILEVYENGIQVSYKSLPSAIAIDCLSFPEFYQVWGRSIFGSWPSDTRGNPIYQRNHNGSRSSLSNGAKERFPSLERLISN